MTHLVPSAGVNYVCLLRYPGLLVGDDGSVWSNRKTRGGYYAEYHKIGGYTMKKGYKQVTLPNNKHRYVHQLVMLGFCGECPEGLQCCHEDGNPKDNRLSNLRYGTPTSNSADTAKHGKGRHRKLTTEQVQSIREEIKNKRRGYSSRLAVKYKVTYQHIREIVRRDIHKGV